MKTSEALREAMKIKNVSVSRMADRIGKSSRLVCERIGQENISVSKLQEMLRVLDYKIVILPREARLPDGGFEIE